MKLISEYMDNKLEVGVEDELNEATGKTIKRFTIEGIFAQAEQKNRNGRIYPKQVMESAVHKYVTEQVKTGRAVGELNHPAGPTINLEKVSHLITDLVWEGNDVVGKARITSTPMGDVVKGLLEDGVKLGVSTRGMGSLEQREGTMYVKDDFMLNTVDIVQDPSAAAAFVNGIYEGREWIYDGGTFTPQEIDRIETEVKGAANMHLPENQIRAFKNFLSLLKLK